MDDLRELTTADAPELASFECRSFGEPWTAQVQELVREHLGESIERGHTHGLGLWRDGQLVGLVAWTQALSDLDVRLRRRGLAADVFVFGGAAMVLGFDARPATRDVDAVWEPHTAVLEEAWATARQFGLPRSWLNDQASTYRPQGERKGDAGNDGFRRTAPCDEGSCRSSWRPLRH